MNRIGVSTAVAVIALSMLASGPEVRAEVVLDFAVQAGGAGEDTTHGIAVDVDGSILVTGNFSGLATFGAGVDAVTLTSAGDADMFVAKYDPAGNLLYVVQAGGIGFDRGLDIAVDGEGNSLVSGSFSSAAAFGTGMDAVTLTSRGDLDMFLAKYDPNGNLLFAVQAGGTNREDGDDIAVNVDGSSLVTGYFHGVATFGTGLDAVTLTSRGGADMFVARYDPAGNLLFVVQAGGATGDEGWGIALDGAGNILVTGEFSGTATFGTGMDTVTLTSADGNIFVAKYDPDGVLLFAVQAGGPGADFGSDIAVDGADNSLVSGFFPGTATFGTGMDAITLTSTGDEDMFVAKYDPDGNLLFVVQAGGTEFDRALAIAVDGAGNSLVTGLFSGTATFGTGMDAITLTSAGARDAFVAKYEDDGNLLFAIRAGGIDLDQGQGIAVDGADNPLVSGFFEDVATFGTGMDAVTLTSTGDHDVFVARYAPPDGDGDGVPDSEDLCANSDLSPIVVIDGCDTGVDNSLSVLGFDGCTITDLIADCVESAATHGGFVSCVAHLTNDLRKDGVISGRQKGAIQRCAARSDLP